jgi:hypothetical protein
MKSILRGRLKEVSHLLRDSMPAREAREDKQNAIIQLATIA